MKHLVTSSTWKFEKEPFPAYRASLVYGRNQHDRAFLPVQGGMEPDPASADTRRYLHQSTGQLVLPRDGNLSEGTFKVIKSREKGTILLVPGEDNSRRLLLMTSYTGGFRGGVRILDEHTTATILAKAAASNACESEIAFAALFEPGQQIVSYSYGRYGDNITVDAWDGEKLTQKVYKKSEWDAANAPQDGDEI